MKKLFLATIILFLSSMAFSQIIREATCEYNKADRPAIIAELDFLPAIVDYGIVQDMKTRGFGKGNSSKGFYEYEGIKFTQICAETIDVFFKIDEKPKDKTKTVLYMLISKGNDNFMSGTSNTAVFSAAREYIKGLIPVFENRKLDLDIEEQHKIIKDGEKEVKDMESKIKSLEKKKEELEKDLEDAKKSLEEQKTKVNTDKQTLESLKGSKK